MVHQIGSRPTFYVFRWAAHLCIQYDVCDERGDPNCFWDIVSTFKSGFELVFGKQLHTYTYCNPGMGTINHMLPS